MKGEQTLSDFFLRAEKDPRLTATHILVFVALWECWRRQRFCSPFFISRRRIMAMTKIKSVATYHKYIRELHAFSYIVYSPSYHPSLGSTISF